MGFVYNNVLKKMNIAILIKSNRAVVDTFYLCFNPTQYGVQILAGQMQSSEWIGFGVYLKFQCDRKTTKTKNTRRQKNVFGDTKIYIAKMVSAHCR